MKLTLKRIAKRPAYTIGRLHIDGVYFCDTLEDTDRGLDDDMAIQQIKAKKVYSETAIPTGTYPITLEIKSSRFGSRQQYAFCKGMLPRLIGVKGYDGVLIHIGNTPKDTSGCILVGKNKAVGQVLESAATFKALYAKLDMAHKKRENITITIER